MIAKWYTKADEDEERDWVEFFFRQEIAKAGVRGVMERDWVKWEREYWIKGNQCDQLDWQDEWDKVNAAERATREHSAEGGVVPRSDLYRFNNFLKISCVDLYRVTPGDHVFSGTENVEWYISLNIWWNQTNFLELVCHTFEFSSEYIKSLLEVLILSGEGNVCLSFENRNFGRNNFGVSTIYYNIFCFCSTIPYSIYV